MVEDVVVVVVVVVVEGVVEGVVDCVVDDVADDLDSVVGNTYLLVVDGVVMRVVVHDGCKQVSIQTFIRQPLLT